MRTRCTGSSKSFFGRSASSSGSRRAARSLLTAATAPVVAIPTTAGTGSEVGRAALITLDDGRKLGFISPHLIPKAAICDPELTLGLPPLARWFDAEVCSDGEAMMDGASGTPHGAFGQCGEFAQNECPGWPGPPEQLLDGCLAQMWAEGPGEPFSEHGHYINMSSTEYTKVACGFAEVGGSIWAVQNFQ